MVARQWLRIVTLWRPAGDTVIVSGRSQPMKIVIHYCGA
jgi:hypothetical protein